MPPKQPQLGSLAIHEPAQPRSTVQISAATCRDLSLFKEILREYRRADDAITMRLNRANAAVRDKDRSQDGTGNIQNQACLNMWRELVENWKQRTKMIEYCVFTVDQSLAEKQTAGEDKSQAGAIFEEEVRRNQVQNELTVESIIRRRTVEAFRSRCQFFVPPSTDPEASKIWNSTQ